ncbi:MAG: hypothetical protein VX475_14540 [Myxococcota bacterium]|jgi:hypothetical protein|nr:hypothetical protein [Myxococcota bacterium]
MSDQQPLFLRLANEFEALPKSFSLTRLSKQTRQYLGRLAWEAIEDPFDAPEPETDLEQIAHGFLTQDISSGVQSSFNARTLQMRIEALRTLAASHVNRADREQRLISLARKEHTYFSGWESACELGAFYQLGADEPWWRPGNFERNERMLEHSDLTPRQRAAEGFVQITQAEYRRRTQVEIMRLLLTRENEQIKRVASILALYTVPRNRRKKLLLLTESLERELTLALQEEVEARGILIPMQPLYSLPREARAMATFFISQRAAEKRLDVDEERQIVFSKENEDFGAKIVNRSPENGQLSLLFFQRGMVNRSEGPSGNRRKDSYIELQLDEEGADAGSLAALLRGIEQLNVDASTLEHLPRVCAGMFTAAQQDRKLSFSWPGTFWDTETGRRLCQTIGFDPDNQRHRQRVRDVRSLLETIILHREVRGRSVQGSNGRMVWSGPVIERRAGEINIELEHREGLTEHNTFRAWSIAKELWDMVIPAEQGGAPSFMKLDQRAFFLDDRSSIPFNLYWTLVNRAYMGSYTSISDDRVNDDGVFKPKIGTLYKWGGLEGRYQRPSQLKTLLRETFTLMKGHGLITHWDCHEVEDDVSISMTDLLELRIEVGLSKNQLQSLKGSYQESEERQLPLSDTNET